MPEMEIILTGASFIKKKIIIHKEMTDDLL